MIETPELMKDLMHQAPALAVYAISGLGILKMVFSHLKTEGEATREVLTNLNTGMQANTTALVGVTEGVRGMQANTVAMNHLLEVVKEIRGDG